MIWLRFSAAVAFVLFASPLSAQMPWGGGDQRIQTIEYRNDQVVRVRASPGYQVTVELAPDERVESIALGDSGAWQVVANKAGNLLYVKPIQADISTNMSVTTDVRTYNFELASVAEASGDLPFLIRFRYPAVLPQMGMNAMPGAGPPGNMIADYRLRGDKTLYPASISDDGARTYIEWPADGPLPAVYSRDGGSEMLVNGNVRGKFFVIDSVVRELVFRIDKRRARAERLPAQEKK
ncbi:TrbG/VirB9 family P-type conjugative transfer protein [Sphingomonas phyllosphaerae]|uniref:TrbG/VirB9 family P-type conjugative transfer protein n=1 Tax=Sphingomonas phyllosphaerae TaxID=257003 RepID=UPI0003B47267|nr:TrbG/VirB9 family P-type conjugative transfer protein [Sphingomonas phyllosphaerae]